MAILLHEQLLDGLSEDMKDLFLENFKKNNYKAGEYIFREGDSGDTLYLVEKGVVILKKSIIGTIEKELLSAKPGDIFGEFSFMDGRERSASAFVQEDAEVLSLSRAEFNGFIKKHPDVGLKVYENMIYILVNRLRHTNELYKTSIAWNLEITGTQKLNFNYIVDENISVRLELIDNRVFEGRILQLEKSDAGHEIILINKAGYIYMIPYHAIVAITNAHTSK